MKPHPRYKASGEVWLGEIPETWSLKRIGELFRERKEKVSDKDFPPLSVSKSGIVPQMESVAKTDAGESRKRICRGDFAINSRSDRKGSSGLSPYDGSTSAITIVLEPRGIEGSFVHHLLRSYGFQEEFYRWGKGIVADLWSTRFSDMRNIQIPLPNESEQTAIANFLDSETAKIDEIVKELDDLVALANEEVSSMVFSSTKSKEMRLAWATNEVSRPLTVGAEGTFTKIGLFNRGRGLFHKDPSEANEMGDSDFFFVEEGDCIISGQFAWEGAVALADKEDTGCVVSHRYPVISGREGVALTEYIYALLCTTHGNFLLNDNSRGAAGRNRPLNIGTLLREKIPIPDITTQERVARAVHKKKEVLKEVKVMKVLLDEYRTSLIHEAVTGKIDLRKA